MEPKPRRTRAKIGWYIAQETRDLVLRHAERIGDRPGRALDDLLLRLLRERGLEEA